MRARQIGPAQLHERLLGMVLTGVAGEGLTECHVHPKSQDHPGLPVSVCVTQVSGTVRHHHLDWSSGGSQDHPDQGP